MSRTIPRRDEQWRCYPNALGVTVDTREKGNDWVYVIQHPFNDSLYKIGSTVHCWDRIRSIITHMGGDFPEYVRMAEKSAKECYKWSDEANCKPMPMVSVYKFYTGNHGTVFDISCRDLEKRLHNVLKHKRRSGEWFELDAKCFNMIDNEAIDESDYMAFYGFKDVVMLDNSLNCISREYFFKMTGER